MAFCKSCGNRIPEDATFCAICGTALDQKAPTPQTSLKPVTRTPKKPSVTQQASAMKLALLSLVLCIAAFGLALPYFCAYAYAGLPNTVSIFWDVASSPFLCSLIFPTITAALILLNKPEITKIARLVWLSLLGILLLIILLRLFIGLTGWLNTAPDFVHFVTSVPGSGALLLMVRAIEALGDGYWKHCFFAILNLSSEIAYLLAFLLCLKAADDLTKKHAS